jgi:hypothetical protein
MGKRRLRLAVIALVLAVMLTLTLTSVVSACPPCCGGGYWYKVVPGDSWYRVARKTGCSVWSLMNANPSLVRWNKWLYVCDWMWIPKCCYTTCCCW